MSKLSDVLKHLIKSELKQGVNANRAYDLEVALDMLSELEKPATVAPLQEAAPVPQKIVESVSKKKEKSDV